jgi:hypothetical protein
MAFSTLDAIRTGALNTELGLTGDSDDRFGTTAQRNFALQDAIRQLWPRMARLTRESVTVVEDQLDYALTTVRDVVLLEQYDEDGMFLSNLANNYRSWWDEEDATPVVRLHLVAPLDTTTSLKVLGYAPYSVPSSSPPSSSGSVDLQPEDEWIIVAGARALLYRRLLNAFVVFERHENENRRTSLSADQIIALAEQAERKFQNALALRPRRIAKVKRATPGR